MTWYWFVGNGFLIFNYCYSIYKNLTPKINKYAYFLIIFVPTLLLVFCRWLPTDISPTVFVIVPELWHVIVPIVFAKDKIRTRFFIVTLTFSGVLILSAISEGILHFFEIEVGNWMSGAIILFVCTIHFFAIRLFTGFRRRKATNGVIDKNIWVFTVFPISQVILLFSSAIIIGADKVFQEGKMLSILGTDKNIAFLFLTFGALVSIVADVIMFFQMKRSAQNEKLREELRFRDYQDKLNLEYYRSLEQSAVDARRMKHDLSNILQISYDLFKDGKEIDRELSKRLMLQLNNSIESLSVERWSENALVNAIVSNKISICRNEKIRCMPVISAMPQLNIEDIDVCRAFVNLFDNAINAAKKLKEDAREIEFECYVDSGILYIKTVNSIPIEVAKTAGGDHGNGLDILSDIAEKYGGSFITENSSGQFTALLALKTE